MAAPFHTVSIGPALFSQQLPLSIIAGPCQIEGTAHAIMMATSLRDICARFKVGFVYKSSFDKANRTSGDSARGVGLHDGLEILARVKAQVGVPVITDVHEADQCERVAAVVDALQIPAFLCRQTDLLRAAGKTGLPVNIKKGQFLAPWDMAHVVDKVTETGNANVLVTERGTSFGYNTLVSDMRSVPIMRGLGAPVIFDATHSVQQPGGRGACSGGQREFVSVLACAAAAIGVAGMFIEVHQDPDRAPSDGPNMLTLDQFERLLPRLLAFDHIAKAAD